jgi:hypothetical protein
MGWLNKRDLILISNNKNFPTKTLPKTKANPESKIPLVLLISKTAQAANAPIKVPANLHNPVATVPPLHK